MSDAKGAVRAEAQKLIEAARASMTRGAEDEIYRIEKRVRALVKTIEVLDLPVDVAKVLARGGAVHVQDFKTSQWSSYSHRGGRMPVVARVGGNDIWSEDVAPLIMRADDAEYRITLVVERLPPDLKKTTGEAR